MASRRGWWIVVIIFVPIIGALLWFVIGRGRRPPVSGGRAADASPPTTTPSSSRRLRNDAEQDERIRRLEQELAELDTEPSPASRRRTRPGTGAAPAPREPRADAGSKPVRARRAGDGFDTGVPREPARDARPDAPGEAGPSGRPNG